MISRKRIWGLWLTMLTVSWTSAQVQCFLSASKKSVLVGEKFDLGITLEVGEKDTLPYFHYQNISRSPNRLFEKDSVDFEPYADIEIFQSEPWNKFGSEDFIRPDKKMAKKENGKLVFSNTLQAAIYNPGIFTIVCPLTKAGTLLDTSRIIVEVIVPEIDSIAQLANADIYPNKPIDEEPAIWTDYLPWLYLLLALAAGYFLWKKRKKKVPPPVTPTDSVIPEKPWEKALRLLTEAEKNRETGSLGPKDFYSRISYILREYIEHELGIPALELSSTEMLELAGKNILVAPPLLASLRHVLHVADQVKFAKAQEGENTADTLAGEIRHFVLTTKPNA